MFPSIFRVGLLALWVQAATAAHVTGILDQHNTYRCMHDADPLTYSLQLATDAQVYANVLAGACGDLVHDATTSDGENLSSCWGTPAPTASCTSGSDATVRWYGEVQYYESAATGYSNTVGKDIGHFTQVVWKDTKQLGCASASCTFYDQGAKYYKTYVVCRYSPHGNYIGKYLENVQGNPTKSLSACSS